MKKKGFILFLYLLLLIPNALCAESIVGFWKSISDRTGKPRSIVAIYEYEGKYYGRMIGTYNRAGAINDTIYNPEDRAPGVVGRPFYAGLDFIYNLVKTASGVYKGSIMDPRKGDVYRASLWVARGDLVVQGKYLFFSRSQVWVPFNDFSNSFKKPDVSEFIPKIPRGR